mgnify:CR=1 FL=1
MEQAVLTQNMPAYVTFVSMLYHKWTFGHTKQVKKTKGKPLEYRIHIFIGKMLIFYTFFINNN